MKKALCSFLFLFVTAACSRQSDPVPVSVPASAPTLYTVGWRVNGLTVSTGHYVSILSRSGSTLTVYGREYANERLLSEVQLEVPAAVGTYAFGAPSAAWATYALRGTKHYAGAAPGASGPTGSGTVVLTALTDGMAVGTFTFTGIDPVTKVEKSVTNGTFRVPF